MQGPGCFVVGFFVLGAGYGFWSPRSESRRISVGLGAVFWVTCLNLWHPSMCVHSHHAKKAASHQTTRVCVLLDKHQLVRFPKGKPHAGKENAQHGLRVRLGKTPMAKSDLCAPQGICCGTLSVQRQTRGFPLVVSCAIFALPDADLG